MMRGRRRAEELGAKPCWVCDGAAGVRDRTLPKDRYESVEHALVTAWNAKFEAHAKEVTEDDVS